MGLEYPRLVGVRDVLPETRNSRMVYSVPAGDPTVIRIHSDRDTSKGAPAPRLASRGA